MVSNMEHKIDPCYKIFLEHLRKDGNSYALEMESADHGDLLFVKYEGLDVPLGNNTTSPSNIKFYKRRRRTTKKEEKSSSFSSSNLKCGYVPIQRTEESQQSVPLDESYEMFLSLLKLEDGLMVLEIEPGVNIKYEQENDSITSSVSGDEDTEYQLISDIVNADNVQTQSTRCKRQHSLDPSDNILFENVPSTDEFAVVPYNNHSDLTALEAEYESSLSICGPSTFEEKLTAVLNEPFSQDEYEELMKKATNRKPVSRQRVLRGASKRYMTGELGLSYLDHYPDLAILIDSASDCYEKLNFLRKLFFWLENLCHPGAYMPWLKSSLGSNPIAADDCVALTVTPIRSVL